MTLRLWQSECIDQALIHYGTNPHFLCQATPGAGKTRMAAKLASELFNRNMIDLVMCFAPSVQVVDGFRRVLEDTLGRPFNGRIGAVGDVVTYQSLEYKDSSFWNIFSQSRVFAIFDEIHHCSGAPANAWGEKVVSEIQGIAQYTLALSGTPWRSDSKSIALSRYSSPEGRLIVDYRYTLEQAISDSVCRVPHLVLLDNNNLKIMRDDKTENSFEGVGELLEETDLSYTDVVTCTSLNLHLLGIACKQLHSIRSKVADAGGLVVASNIRHAYQIVEYLQQLGERAEIVSTKSEDAASVIDNFRRGQSRWIIAVGMISEGTDIPRLQVCCYLSSIRTELYFRQVLGRVLRRRAEEDCYAWMYLIAEPSLWNFAKRLKDDLPADCGVIELKNYEAETELGIDHPPHDTCSIEGREVSTSDMAARFEVAEKVRTGNVTVEPDIQKKSYQLVVSGMYREHLLSLL